MLLEAHAYFTELLKRDLGITHLVQSDFSGVSLPGVDGGHASEKSFLTGAPGAIRGSFRNSISPDQFMAEKIGGETRFPALTLMIGSDNLSLSWTRSGSMIPPQSKPLKLYQQLFVEDTPEGKATAVQRLKDDRSLLDSLREKAARLQRAGGAADRERLDQYFTSVRELERRLASVTPKIIPGVQSNTHELSQHGHPRAGLQGVQLRGA